MLCQYSAILSHFEGSPKLTLTLEMNCCENFTFQHETKRCANINIPLDETADDKVFRTNHKACMKFTRSDRDTAVNEIDIESFHINVWKRLYKFS